MKFKLSSGRNGNSCATAHFYKSQVAEKGREPNPLPSVIQFRFLSPENQIDTKCSLDKLPK